MLKDIDLGTPILLELMTEASQIAEVNIYLIREDTGGMGEVYFQIDLFDVYITLLHSKLLHLGQLQFAHVDEVGFGFDQIRFEDMVSGNSWCWDVSLSQPGGCP